MHAANAEGLIDDGNSSFKRRFVGERQYIGAEQRCETSNRVIAPWRAKIDRNTVVDDGLGIRAATRVTALGTLGLWEQFVDLFNKLS